MIVYSDKALVVCLKSAGVTSEEGGMPQLLRAELGGGEIYCVHRLDRETAGLMVYARTRSAAASLSASIARRELGKEYLAVVQGTPPERGELRDLLYHDAGKNKSYVVKRLRRGVREAVLDYETLESRAELSLVRVRLHTGRSHQIRVQFASRGFPLAGDLRYGSRLREWPLALFASALSFSHPESGQTLRFSAAPPPVPPWTLFEAARQTGKFI